jgi:tetratricopeptide (TPR) repeat protein
MIHNRAIMRHASFVSVRRSSSVSVRRASSVAMIALIAACHAAARTGDSPQAIDARTARLAAEAHSLLGEPLFRPRLDSAVRARLQADLARAQADAIAHPDDPDALIWVGRRLAYLGEYKTAILGFTEGIRRFPNDPRMYRHRGHRYITVRRFDDAITDFERAAHLMAGHPDEVEPDGQPNARNIPIGSLQSNVWYHLALARYLKGDWNAAVLAARAGIGVSTNPDRLVSQTHWLYMALRRAGRHTEAAASLEPIRDDFDIIENQSYYRLLKLYRSGISAALLDSVLYAGVASASDASLAYGLANWFLYNGDTARALGAFQHIVNGDQWPSFGFVAAEADLARLRDRK